MEVPAQGLMGNKIWTGLLIGIIIPIISLIIYYVYNFNNITFFAFYNQIAKLRIASSLISLFLLPNLLVFYYFLNREKYTAAKGVLLAVFIYGAIELYFKFYI